MEDFMMLFRCCPLIDVSSLLLMIIHRDRSPASKKASINRDINMQVSTLLNRMQNGRSISQRRTSREEHLSVIPCVPRNAKCGVRDRRSIGAIHCCALKIVIGWMPVCGGLCSSYKRPPASFKSIFTVDAACYHEASVDSLGNHIIHELT